MSKYDFTNENGILKISLQLQSGLYKSQIMALSTPSASLNNDTIKVYDAGQYRDSFFLSDIGIIDSASYTDILVAFEDLVILIAEVLKAQNSSPTP